MKNKEAQNIIVQLDRLESEYKRNQVLMVLIGIPTLIISFALPVTILTALVVVLLMPITGEFVGFIIYAALILVWIPTVDRFHKKMMNQFFPSDGQASAINKFAETFPLENEAKRKQAIDILDENFDKYQIAKLFIESPSGINWDAFKRLINDTGTAFLGKDEFLFKCDQSLLEENEIIALKKYGNWFEAITTGEFKPTTRMQRQFLAVHEGKIAPTTEPEKIWKSYIDMAKWQKKINEMDAAAFGDYRISYPYLDKKSESMSRLKW